MIRTALPASALFAVMLVTGAALGAPSDEQTLDLAKIRAEAAKYEPEAEALAAIVRTRAEGARDEAQTTQKQAEENGRQYVEAVKAVSSRDTGKRFDFDKLITEVNSTDVESLGASPRFIAFASTSMPPDSLKAMLIDVPKAGGVVVFRGFPENNMKLFAGKLMKAASSRNAIGNAGIDPRLFRAFDIKVVPTYVVVSSNFELCDGFDCEAQVPPHDRLTGNVSAHYALETFAEGSGPGAPIAKLLLSNFKKAKP
jgi:conjugal transfer pilus assembly protein TrbC